MAKTTAPMSGLSALISTRRQAIDRTLAGLKLLPSNAAVAMKVLELKRRGDAGAAEFAQVVSGDSGLAGSVLALANSAAFAPATPVTRISHAIAQIGLSNLLPLTLGGAFAGIFNKLSLPPEDQTMLWKASLLKAVTAAACVRKIGGAFGTAEKRETVAEEAFLAGLLQDCALPIFNVADRSAWPELMALLDNCDDNRAQRESKLYAIDHASVSGACARLLGLPELFAKIAETHHRGVSALTAAGAGPLAIGVDAAASLPHRLASPSAKTLQTITSRLRSTANPSANELIAVAREITTEFSRITAMFAQPEDASASYKQFLQNLGIEVADCFRASIMSNASEISGLKERQRRLSDAMATLEDKTQRAEFDPLTNALTRPALLDRLEKLLPMARRHGAGCAIGFMDLDNFKQINDTHGHPAGDAALVATAALIRASLGGSGIVGRMGGDEFVFALVARPDALDRVVKEFLSRIARVEFQSEGVALAVTTSVGVMPIGVPAPDADAHAALKAADQLMYQAKRAGKGRGALGASMDGASASVVTKESLAQNAA
ncbi:MAG TPA: diguanylate cyclase [Tepidisphaeraceae bacterium]